MRFLRVEVWNKEVGVLSESRHFIRIILGFEFEIFRFTESNETQKNLEKFSRINIRVLFVSIDVFAYMFFIIFTLAKYVRYQNLWFFRDVVMKCLLFSQILSCVCLHMIIIYNKTTNIRWIWPFMKYQVRMCLYVFKRFSAAQKL